MQLDYIRSLAPFLKDIIIQAGRIAIQQRSNIRISKKKDGTFVTSADKAISKFIYQMLSILTPNIKVICEERTITHFNNESTFWLIDPIDSTFHYINKENTYTINIALIYENEPVIGLIYQPDTKRVYYTDSDGNFAIEQDGIKVSPKSNLMMKSCVAAVSLNGNTNIKQFLNHYNIMDIISISSSIKFCYVAEGRADVYPRFSYNMEWDVAAGHALLKSVGGDIIDIGTLKPMSYGKSNFLNVSFLAYGSRWNAFRDKIEAIDGSVFDSPVKLRSVGWE